MGNQVKRRHHTVPRFILKNFSDDPKSKTKTLAAWRRDGKRHDVSVGDATVIKDFYNTPNSDSGPVDVVEDWLAKDVEDPVAPLIARIVAADLQPGPDAVTQVAALVASGVLRTATVRSYLKQIGEVLGPSLVMHEMISKSGHKPSELSPAAMEHIEIAATAAWKQRATDDTYSLLRTFLREFVKTRETMTGWRWSVAVSVEPLLIISDAPVATLHLQPGWHGILPPGSPACMPLSPRHLLVGEPDTFGPRPTILTAALARMVNERVAAEAHDAIYTTPERPWPSYLHLGPTPPTLPPANITWSDSDPGTPSTFPASYPEISDPKVAALIYDLGGIDHVE